MRTCVESWYVMYFCRLTVILMKKSATCFAVLLRLDPCMLQNKRVQMKNGSMSLIFYSHTDILILKYVTL